MDRPVVSVVTPCYKQARYLAESIESVLSQDVRVEMIVVDDGSPDDTAAVARRFEGRVRYVRQSNQGLAAARNNGAAVAGGEYLVFLDADDALVPGALRALLDAAMASPQAAVFCGGRREVDAVGRVLRRFPAPELLGDALHRLLAGNIAPPACFMLCRSAFLTSGRFGEGRMLRGHEDWDLWLRLARDGNKFMSVPTEVCAYRITSGSMSHNGSLMFGSGVYVLRRARRYHTNCGECQRRIKQGLAVLRRYHAAISFGGGLDTASNAAEVLRTLWKSAEMVKVDPMYLAYIAKAIVSRPWRRGVGGRAIAAALGRVPGAEGSDRCGQ